MTLSTSELSALTDEALAVARRAGQILLQGLSIKKTVEHKGRVDLVTEFDRRSEELIVEGLSLATPKFSILAEESGLVDAGPQRWIVDPLDGTTNFAHGHPFFAVSIGLEVSGNLGLGVILMPALGLTVHAYRGGGAFCNGEPIRVSEQPRLSHSLLSTGFPYDRVTAVDNNTRQLAAFVRQGQGVRRCGAAAVDLAFLARGVYDGFWEPKLAPWDLAAGALIVEEAGGMVTDYDGAPLDIYDGWIVASNGAIHAAMLQVLQGEAELPNPSIDT